MHNRQRGASESSDWTKIVDQAPLGWLVIGLGFLVVPTLVIFASGKPLRDTVFWREPILQGLVALFYGIGAIVLTFGIIFLRRKLRLDRAASEVSGKVVDATYLGKWTWALTIEWVPEGHVKPLRLVRQWRLPGRIDRNSDLRGVEVALQYDPQNPKVCRCYAIRL